MNGDCTSTSRRLFVIKYTVEDKIRNTTDLVTEETQLIMIGKGWKS